MLIKARLFFQFKELSPDGEGQFEMNVAESATVGQVLAELGLPEARKKVTLVNGRQAALDQRLEPDDLLVVFPPVEGG